MSWMGLYNRAPTPFGRIAVLVAAGLCASVKDTIATIRELAERDPR